MIIIGICGGSGSGKGYVAAILEERGIPVVDCDRVYHAMTASPSECTTELAAAFGNGVLRADGSLDRSALAEAVFGDADALGRLNGITHRLILARVREILGGFAEEGLRAAAVDAPLLYESGFDRECDFVIAVSAPREVRLERIMKRDKISREAAVKRADSQLSDEILRERAKYTVENGRYTDPAPQIDSILDAEGL